MPEFRNAAEQEKQNFQEKTTESLFFLSISDMMNHLFVLVLDDRKQL